MRKTCFVISILISLLILTGCPNGNIDHKVILPVPYCVQLASNYCAVACIQMWSEYDGRNYNQNVIGPVLDVSGAGLYPGQVEIGVGVFTNSPGWLEIISQFEPGAQGDLIAGCVESIKSSVPAIMPFYFGTHAVLVVGSKWDEGENRPIAKVLYFHDPDPTMGSTVAETAGMLKDFYFTPADMCYFIIYGAEIFFLNGLVDHDWFVQMGGTYYGGPNLYNPKNLPNIELPGGQ